MTANLVIARLHGDGLFIKSISGHLHVSPKEQITDENRALIKAYKDDLVDFLETYEERAAIMEYDGGLSRTEAEARAFEDCKATEEK